MLIRQLQSRRYSLNSLGYEELNRTEAGRNRTEFRNESGRYGAEFRNEVADLSRSSRAEVGPSPQYKREGSYSRQENGEVSPPSRQNRGEAGPNRQYRDEAGPSRQYRGEAGPSRQDRDEAGPSRQYRGEAGPSRQYRGEAGPSRQYRDEVSSIRPYAEVPKGRRYMDNAEDDFSEAEERTYGQNMKVPGGRQPGYPDTRNMNERVLPGPVTLPDRYRQDQTIRKRDLSQWPSESDDGKSDYEDDDDGDYDDDSSVPSAVNRRRIQSLKSFKKDQRQPSNGTRNQVPPGHVTMQPHPGTAKHAL